MRSPNLWLIVVALCAMPTAARSDPASPPPAPAPASYLLAPGDVIEVSVTSHSGYDRTMTIQPDGLIHMPMVPEILAAGLTPTQLAARIQEALNVELIDPRVTVTLRESRRDQTRQVTLLGAVRSPGVYALKSRGSLAELLATAGGPIPGADLGRITITGVDRSQVRTVNLSALAQTGRADADVALESGELVIVPTGAPPTITVQMTGQLRRPGSLEVPRESRVMDAITQAGGPTPQADISRLRLTRAGQTQILNLQSAALEGAADSPANLPLQPGDSILVCENESHVYLLGAVATPGAQPLHDEDRLFDVLTRAGGASPGADLSKCLLIRRNEQNQPVAQRLDLKPMLTKGDMKKNLALQPGDVVVFPARNTKTSKGLAGLLAPFTGLFGLLRYGF
jgi:polysaccharide export outer membrane protein